MNKILEKVTEMLKPHPVYLVGGAVRDYLMGDEPKDYDFCTPLEPDEIEKIVQANGRRAYLTGKRFGTIGFKVEIDEKFHMVEVTTFRAEEYATKNRKPKVKYVKSITEDLSRRDFTINAMAIRLTKGHLRIIDPFCGQEDLEHRLIRAVGNPKQRFKEDPLRILRAVRFAARLNFEIEELTYKKMQKMAIHILDISKERWMMELDKILQSENVERGLMDLWKSNLFKFMIPELELQSNYDQNSAYHPWNLDVHTIKVVEAVRKETDDLNLLWAALLHDIAKPFVRTDKIVLEKTMISSESKRVKSNYIGHQTLGAEMVDRIATNFKWSNERREEVISLVKNHLEDNCPLRKYDNEGKSENGNRGNIKKFKKKKSDYNGM